MHEFLAHLIPDDNSSSTNNLPLRKIPPQLTTSSANIFSTKSYTIIKTPRTKPNGDREDAYYCFNHDNILGRGVSGTVFLGREIDAATGQPRELIDPETGQPRKLRFTQTDEECCPYVAIKIINEYPVLKRNIEREARLQQAYYDTEQLIIPTTTDKTTNDAYKDKAILITEWLPGHNLSDKRAITTLSKLSCSQRITLVTQLAMQLSMFHGSPPRRGNAIAHCDIYERNIRLSQQRKNDKDTNTALERTNASIIDFGLAKILDPDTITLISAAQNIELNAFVEEKLQQYPAPFLIQQGNKTFIYGRTQILENKNIWTINQLLSNTSNISFPSVDQPASTATIDSLPQNVKDEIKTNSYHIKRNKGHYNRPPEAATGQLGTETDIYMLVDPITQILGAQISQKTDAYMKSLQSPNNDKTKATEDEIKTKATKAAIATKCTLNSKIIFPDPQNGLNLKTITQAFLDFMQDDRPDFRPTTAQVLRFFTTLNILCRACETSGIDHETKDIYSAKLILLINDYWKAKIGEKELTIVTTSAQATQNSAQQSTSITKNQTSSVAPSSSASTPTNVSKIKKTVEDYDFASNPKVCRAIIELFKIGLFANEKLIKNILSLLLPGTDQAKNLAKAINALAASNMLTTSNLQLITPDTDQAKNLATAINALAISNMLNASNLQLITPDTDQAKNLAKVIIMLAEYRLLSPAIIDIFSWLSADPSYTPKQVAASTFLESCLKFTPKQQPKLLLTLTFAAISNLAEKKLLTPDILEALSPDIEINSQPLALNLAITIKTLGKQGLLNASILQLLLPSTNKATDISLAINLAKVMNELCKRRLLTQPIITVLSNLKAPATKEQQNVAKIFLLACVKLIAHPLLLNKDLLDIMVKKAKIFITPGTDMTDKQAEQQAEIFLFQCRYLEHYHGRLFSRSRFGVADTQIAKLTHADVIKAANDKKGSRTDKVCKEIGIAAAAAAA